LVGGGALALVLTDQLDYDAHATAGELFVGVGTLALAAFTAWLANRTSQEVDITRRSVEAAEEGVRAQDRPFMVAIRGSDQTAIQFITRFEEYGVEQAELPPESWAFVFRLWNMGKGPAIVSDVLFEDVDGRQVLAETGLEVLVAAPGEIEQRRELSAPQRVPKPGTTCTLWITYRDAAGVKYETRSQVEVDQGGVCRCRNFVQARAFD
jgi:hypothetical protein